MTPLVGGAGRDYVAELRYKETLEALER